MVVVKNQRLRSAFLGSQRRGSGKTVMLFEAECEEAR